nr:type IV pilus secretin PilQ [Halomonas sp. DP1Y21-3]
MSRRPDIGSCRTGESAFSPGKAIARWLVGLVVGVLLVSPGWAQGEGYQGAPITLNFQDVEVRSVLSVLSDFTGLNIVASDSVAGRVTLNLEAVPWDQALDMVLESQGLDSRRQGDILLVAPASELAERDRLKLEAASRLDELEPLVTEHIEVRYAKAAELAALLRGENGFGLLSDRGRVATDPRTNTLLVQDVASQLDEIRWTLARLDVPVRQVQISARIVVARDNTAEEIGVNWGARSRHDKLPVGGGDGALSGALGESVQIGDGVFGNRGDAYGGLGVDLGDALDPGSSFKFGYLAGDVLLDLELHALESEGKSQTISEPRVITANQHTALIKQGKEIPYQESTSSGATNVEFKEAVLALEVTPQITSDDRIVMDLTINNDTLAEQSFDGEPAIDTNEIQTQVLVEDGETVVLGGILTTQQLHTLYKTPWLGDIPWLGKLFRYTEDVNDKVELLVFITPRILDDGLATH